MNIYHKLGIVIALLSAVLVVTIIKTQPTHSDPLAETSAIAGPRVVDLGADACIPCKLMAPILEELRNEYRGRLQVDFIDVWKNPDAGKRYGIHQIPTQIFYDASGKEFERHEGFISKEDILAKFAARGVSLAAPSPKPVGESAVAPLIKAEK
jgi:thioredoxin 1